MKMMTKMMKTNVELGAVFCVILALLTVEGYVIDYMLTH